MNRDASRREEVLSLAQHLISIESHKDEPGREAEIGRFLVRWFRNRGIDAELQPVEGDRANVMARIPGGRGPSLMLCGHLDTVPPGDMPDAFAPRVEDGLLWGRGACDMKGAISAMAVAMSEIVRDRRQSHPRGLAGDLVFVGTVDEETGGLGVKAAVESGVRTDYAVVGEPTSLRVALAHKGACFVRVTLSGRAAHGSCPEQGVSAISYAAKIVRVIEEDLRPKLLERTYPLLGSSTVSVGRVSGGSQPNIVAERCEIDIDRRMVPGDADPLVEVQALVEETCSDVEDLSYDVAEMPMTSVVPHTPLGSSADSHLARAAMEVCRQAGLPDEPVGVSYWSDGGHLAACGIESIVLGPGDIANAHGPRDRVAIEELVGAVSLYREIALRLLGGAT